MRHSWVLLVAILLPVLAPRAVLTTAGAGGSGSGDNSVMLTASIERTNAPQAITRPAQTIVVQPHQSLEGLATQYHVDVAALRWANDIEDGQEPEWGSTLLVPPGSGALIRVEAGERPSHVAARLGIDPRVVLDYNQLHRDSPLAAGTYLQIPLASSPSGALLADNVVPVSTGVPGVTAAERSRGNIYPYGQCTWYVASRRNVTWTGNAWQWWAAARGIRPEGHVPVVNAIVVMDTGWAGHVGIVDRVNPDGTFVMSEMNYFGNGGGWGRVDQRVLSADEPWIMGFVY